MLGPIATAKLGLTLSHEHICASSAGMWQAWPQMFGGRDRFVRDAVDKLTSVLSGGAFCAAIDSLFGDGAAVADLI